MSRRRPFSAGQDFYGADVGGASGDHDANIAASPIASAQAINTTFSGVIGGGFAGYNYQINQFLVGVQGDIQGLGVSGTTFSPPTDLTSRLQGDWLGAINGVSASLSIVPCSMRSAAPPSPMVQPPLLLGQLCRPSWAIAGRGDPP